jgi:hypothetical protein
MAYWHTGVMAYWHTGVLAYWRTGVLTYWRTGVLTLKTCDGASGGKYEAQTVIFHILAAVNRFSHISKKAESR